MTVLDCQTGPSPHQYSLHQEGLDIGGVEIVGELVGEAHKVPHQLSCLVHQEGRAATSFLLIPNHDYLLSINI